MKEISKDAKIETKCLHSGYSPKNGEPRVMPIVQSTTYVYDSTDDVAAVFDDPTKSLIYSRFENPTTDVVEKKIAALEGGVAAMCTSSGTWLCLYFFVGMVLRLVKGRYILICTVDGSCQI